MPRKKILKDFELTEISGVDNPAQPTALMSIMKRKEKTDPMDINKGSKLGDRLTSLRDSKDLTNSDLARAAGISEDTVGAILSGDIKTPPERRIKGFARVLGVSFESLNQLVPKMEKKYEELEDQINELTKSLADATFLAKLHDDEKEFMRDMDDNAKTAFKAMDEAGRKAKMAVAKSADESIVIAGETISKSVIGDSMFAVMKSQQAQLARNETEIAKAKDVAEVATLEKRASDEFSHLPGTATEIASVLKALKDAPEEVVKAAEAIFKSAEGTAVKAFGKQGTKFSKSDEGASAEEKLDTLAKAYSDEHKVDYVTAYTTVLEKNTDLYEQTISES